MMDYRAFSPRRDLSSIVKCYWTLEIPEGANPPRQRILPDGCIEMAFILGDDLKRYTARDDFVILPRSLVLGQFLEPFFLGSTGYVNSFSIRFQPHGFSYFVPTPIRDLLNKERPIAALFGETAAAMLEEEMVRASDTRSRIELIEGFLLGALNEKRAKDQIVERVIGSLLETKGRDPLYVTLNEDASIQRRLERNFSKRVGISPKQLSKVIRFQGALRHLLNDESGCLGDSAYDSHYYDQAHFIKEFKSYTGVLPKEFNNNSEMAFSSLIYRSG